MKMMDEFLSPTKCQENNSLSPG